MPILYNESISAGDDIWIPLNDFGGVMTEKKDLTLVIEGSGGVLTGPTDVTMGVSIWCDIDPPDDTVAGDSETYANLTPSAYRVDQNAKVDAAEVQFTGATSEIAWLDLDDLNADRMKIKVTFTAAPDATAATLLIKSRRDSV